MTDFFRPTVLPIDPFGTPDTGFRSMRVTSPYGNRSDQVGDRPTEFHGGLDIGNARLGDKVCAIGRGTVVLASRLPAPPWNWPTPESAPDEWGPSYGGLVVVIRHPDGRWSQYAHLGSRQVLKGEVVASGEIVGLVGESGSAWQRGHLHFGIRDPRQRTNGHDGWVDPWPLIQPTGPWEDPAVIAELRSDLERCQTRVQSLKARRDSLLGEIAALEDELAEVESIAAQVPALQDTLRRLRLRVTRLRNKVAELEQEEPT
jgi:murein DD-endopeptidase MepM/ murein hydrolase activator NlpD